MGRRQLSLWSFQGRWAIRREILDALNGQDGRLEGQAVLRPNADDPNALHYEERGRLRIGDAPPMAAERRFVWREATGPDRIEVLFDDGRPFHAIDLNRTMPDDEHYCAPDGYGVSYDFRNWPVWTTEWHVRGPKKNYRMWTRYDFVGQVDVTGVSCASPGSGAQTSTGSTAADRGTEWQSTLPTRS